MKVKITEVAIIQRTRIVELETDEVFNHKVYDMDEGDHPQLDVITRLVNEQHSTKNDICDQVIKAEIL